MGISGLGRQLSWWWGTRSKDEQAFLSTLLKKQKKTKKNHSLKDIKALFILYLGKSGTYTNSFSRPFSMGESIFDPVPILTLNVMFPFLLRSQLFIWQAHNALFMIRCLLKVFIREMSEEELHLHFSYQERAPGSCGGESLLNAGKGKKDPIKKVRLF